MNLADLRPTSQKSPGRAASAALPAAPGTRGSPVMTVPARGRGAAGGERCSGVSAGLAAPQGSAGRGGAPRPSAAARVPTSLRHAGAAPPRSLRDEPEPRGGRPRGARRSGAARGTAAGRGGRSPPAGGGAGRHRGAAPTFPVGSRLSTAARPRTALSVGDDGRPAGSRLPGGGLLLSEGERRAEPRGSVGSGAAGAVPIPGGSAAPRAGLARTSSRGARFRLAAFLPFRPFVLSFALRLRARSRVIAACSCRKLTRARRRS